MFGVRKSPRSPFGGIRTRQGVSWRRGGEAMTRRDMPSADVLRYGSGASQDTVRRHYRAWRATQEPPLPDRCDNQECRFFSEPLLWNGSPLKLILDHLDGVRWDNRPESLRLLCPNCDSQLATRGGGNRGRVKMSSGGFAVRDEDGRQHHRLPAEPGSHQLVGSDAMLPRQSGSESSEE